MKQSIQFIYDGVSSEDMGVFIAWSDDGLFEENFLPNRQIIEKKIANREKPYFQRVEHEPLSFSLSFAIADWENKETLRKLARWFFQPYYKPLVFDSNPNRVFYAIFEGEPQIFHNGLNEGYIELDIRCDSPYSYSFEHTKENIELRDSNIGSKVQLDINNFDLGQMSNMQNTTNGLTITTTLSTWGNVYATNTTWGGIT
ncbi:MULTISPECIES: distal tail protein Dit [unclassified Lysinibacillus]|uniref:distal tail protein Dit n=1 Tax=unclassified Lysinibacillus TaxID=2636778 RepID=UPI003811C6E7